MWSGIYKITWQNLASLKSWIEMCNETVLQQLKGVEEYKNINKAINSILAEVQRKQNYYRSYRGRGFIETLHHLMSPLSGDLFSRETKVSPYCTKLKPFLLDRGKENSIPRRRGRRPG